MYQNYENNIEHITQFSTASLWNQCQNQYQSNVHDSNSIPLSIAQNIQMSIALSTSYQFSGHTGAGFWLHKTSEGFEMGHGIYLNSILEVTSTLPMLRLLSCKAQGRKDF